MIEATLIQMIYSMYIYLSFFELSDAIMFLYWYFELLLWLRPFNAHNLYLPRSCYFSSLLPTVVMFTNWSVIHTHLNLSILFTLQLKNLSAMEVNIVRPFVVRALQAFYKHDSPEMIPQPDATGDKRPQVANRGPRVSWVTFLLVICSKGSSWWRIVSSNYMCFFPLREVVLYMFVPASHQVGPS